MYKTVDGDLNAPKLFKHIIIVLIAFTIIFGSFGVVSAGERGVKVRLGNVVGVIDSGFYFKLPLIEKVEKVSVQTQTVTYERENPLAAASNDLQDVQVATVVNYSIDATKVAPIYVQYRDLENFEEKIVRPAVRDIVKATASKYTAEELVTKRAEFTDAVKTALANRLTDSSALIEQVNITNFQFSPSFSAAIEAKVTAVQNAEAQKNKLEQVKYEAQQKIETAKADAESIRIQAQAINSQGGADYVALQKVKTWDGKSCTSYCGLEAMFITTK